MNPEEKLLKAIFANLPNVQKIVFDGPPPKVFKSNVVKVTKPKKEKGNEH